MKVVRRCGDDRRRRSRPRRRAAGAAALLLVVGWSLGGSAGAAHAQAPPPREPAPVGDAGAGPPVARVELRSDVPLDHPEEILALLSIPLGAPLDEAAVRRALRNVQATGLAEEVELWTRPADEGLVVTLALWGAVLVEEVRLEGETGLRREALSREIVQSAGQPLVEDRVLRSVYRLQDRLVAEGYRSAQVRADVDLDEARKRADVAFRVEAGPRATVRTVALAGDLGPFAPETLRDALRSRPGEAYRESVARDDADRLARWLFERGYRQAEVELLGATYDPANHLVDLRLRVDVGPEVELVVSGASRETLERRGLLPFLGEEGYDEVLVLQSIERIRRDYQERGHHEVRVTREETRENGRIRLRLHVEPGPVFTLRDVRFEGNEEVSADRLAQLMTTTPRKLLVPGSGRLVDEVVRQDLENVRSWYALQGFSRARVGPPRVEEEGDALTLVVPIHEGPRTRLVSLDLDGVAALDEEALRRTLPLQPGGPFHPRLLEETLDRIRAAYDNEGYGRAQVSATTEASQDGTLVDVDVHVLEGPRQVFGKLILRGNQRTQRRIVETYADLRAGEPVSTRKILEIQRDLYRLGIFSRVAVSLAPAADDARIRDVVVKVEEGTNQRIAYGLGYDSEQGFGGLVGYSHANLFGRAVQLQLDLRASEKADRYRLLLRQPYWGGAWPGAINTLLYKESEDRPSFDADRRGVQVELTRGEEDLRFSLFGDYRRVVLDNVLVEPGPDEREFESVDILSVTPRVTLDRRDDPLDPHRGFLASALFEYAFPAGNLAEEHFLKWFGQGVVYLELGGGGVLAASGRAGGIEPLDGGETVAISERFFAGGRTTHRAYGRDRLGREDTFDAEGDPGGGNGLLLFNVDYRFPIAGAFGGTLFVDAGNLWPRWEDVDVREVKLGAGLGVRYLSPVGPLRIEIGWKLDRDPGESLTEIFVSFGNAF